MLFSNDCSFPPLPHTACVSTMMIVFMCTAIGVLAYKVCVQQDDCEDMETELEQQPGHLI